MSIDIITALEDLRQEYRRNGYELPASVVLRKSTDRSGVRYYVEHDGVKLGWAIKVGNKWGSWVVDGVGTGRRFETLATRKAAAEEIVWHAGVFENARKIADAHERLHELLGGS